MQADNKRKKTILVGIENTQLGYKLSHIPDYTKTIPAFKITLTTQNNLPSVAPIYMGFAHNMNRMRDDIVQANWEQTIDAHYGYMEATSTLTGETHTLVIPIDVTTIRAKVMELLEQPLPSTQQLAQNIHPYTKKLEKDLLQQLETKPNIHLHLVYKAITIIKTYHYYQKRKSGAPFYTHPIEVTRLLLEITQDQTAIITALLHDAVEDTKLSLQQINIQFGPAVARLVSALTDLTGNLQRLQLSDYEQLVKLQENQDKRVLQIKLADRLHNMRTIVAMSMAKQREKANSTLHFYVPLATNLGLNAWAHEFKAMALKVLNKNKQ